MLIQARLQIEQLSLLWEPQQVIDAAFLLIKKAKELIDMSKHSGEHPRMKK